VMLLCGSPVITSARRRRRHGSQAGRLRGKGPRARRAHQSPSLDSGDEAWASAEDATRRRSRTCSAQHARARRRFPAACRVLSYKNRAVNNTVSHR
jgi:hypothetical protein